MSSERKGIYETVSNPRGTEVHRETISFPLCSSVSPVVKKFAGDGVPLFLLLALHVFFDLGEGFAVVFGAGVYGVERVGQQEFILARFGGMGVRGVLEGAQLGLKFGVGFDDDFQRLADVVLTSDVHVDVVVEFVVHGEEIFQHVMRLAGAIGRLGIAAHLLKFGHAIPRELHVELQALLRVEHGVAELVDLQWIERIAAALGPKRRADWQAQREREQQRQTERGAPAPVDFPLHFFSFLLSLANISLSRVVRMSSRRRMACSTGGWSSKARVRLMSRSFSAILRISISTFLRCFFVCIAPSRAFSE